MKTLITTLLIAHMVLGLSAQPLQTNFAATSAFKTFKDNSHRPSHRKPGHKKTASRKVLRSQR
jgi:hypothetical protein